MVATVEKKIQGPVEQAFLEAIGKDRSPIIDRVRESNGGSLSGIARIDASLPVILIERGGVATKIVEMVIWPNQSMAPRVRRSMGRQFPIPGFKEIVTVYKY